MKPGAISVQVVSSAFFVGLSHVAVSSLSIMDLSPGFPPLASQTGLTRG